MEPAVHSSKFYPTWRRWLITALVVRNMSVKDKRQIFALMRSEMGNVDHNTLLLQHGITLGDFALFHMLADQALPEVD